MLAGELLKESKGFIEEGMHPQIVIQGYKTALTEVMKYLDENAVKISRDDP